MKKINKNVIWWVIVLSISFWTVAYSTSGTLWNLFILDGSDYKLIWSNIKDSSVWNLQLDGTDSYIINKLTVIQKIKMLDETVLTDSNNTIATKWYVDNNWWVPSWAVMAFALWSCPSGWSAYSAANWKTIIWVWNSWRPYSTYHNYWTTWWEEKHRLTISEMPSHTHRYYTWNSSSYGGWYDAKTDKMFNRSVNSWWAWWNQAHNNMQPFITLRYCRKN